MIRWLVFVLLFATVDSNRWLESAAETARYSHTHLRRSGGNYVNSTADGAWTFCWDNFSQFGALVALFAASESNCESNCESKLDDCSNCERSPSMLLRNASMIIDWQLKYLWRRDDVGGFYSAALSDGSYVDVDIQYSDDNAFAGLTALESRELLLGRDDSDAALLAERCLDIARACARWLVDTRSGAWDCSAGGGGFWWNVSTAASCQACVPHAFRPGNAAALATLLFAKLAAIDDNGSSSGGRLWQRWAADTVDWMWRALHNPNDGLLDWYVDARNRPNAAHFAYSNALAARAFLELGDGDEWRQRGVALFAAVDSRFWNATARAWVESTLVPWGVSTVLSGWVSKTAREIIVASGSLSARWQSHACDNVDYIHRALRNSSSGGAYLDSSAIGTPAVATAGVYTTLNCAWGQWITALLANVCDFKTLVENRS
jgi:hypothetical protein